jgi:hypothetical protein
MRFLPLLLILALASCRTDRSAIDRERAEAVASLESVSYHRSGGLAGSSDHITISRTGTVQVTGRLFGESSTLLSEFQMMQLARLFEGWEKLADHYPAAQGAADDFVTEIRYGDKTVVASDAARNMPDQFVRAKQRLELLVRDLRAK